MITKSPVQLSRPWMYAVLVSQDAPQAKLACARAQHYVLGPVEGSELPRDILRAVWRVVVDDNDLKVEAILQEHATEQEHDDRQIVTLIVGREDDTVLVSIRRANWSASRHLDYRGHDVVSRTACLLIKPNFCDHGASALTENPRAHAVARRPRASAPRRRGASPTKSGPSATSVREAARVYACTQRSKARPPLCQAICGVAGGPY